MASQSRSSQFTKLHKVLKKHYQAVAPDPDRAVFLHLVFASCLENAPYDRADEALAALEHNFFDWNEIRVSAVSELAEVIAGLPDPAAAANRVKRVLQSIFESTYSFDLEDLRKQNLGPAVDYLKKLDGTTNFSVAYVVQAALGGHAIPVDDGTLNTLCILGLITEENVKAGEAPGLERAIAKSKGPEFGSQLHQLGAECFANPYSAALRKTLLEIDPHAKDRLPKRGSKKQSVSTDEEAAQVKQTAPAKSGKRSKPEKTEAAEAPKKTGRKKKSAEEKLKKPEKPEEAKKKTSEDQQTASAKKSTGEPSVSGEQKAAAKKKSTTKKADNAKSSDAGTKKSTSAGLSKRKPR